MPFWLYDGAFATPDTAIEFSDEDHEWEEILADPDVVTDKDQKVRAPAVCGAQYRPGATSKEQTPENLVWSHGLVLDVDYWDHPDGARWPSRAPFTPDELRTKMDDLGVRYIAFSTYSSSEVCWKWRVVIPFMASMPPAYYGPCWDLLNDHLEGCMSEATRDAGRLGFVHIVNSESNKDAYKWWIGQGERLDWGALDLVPEEDFSLKRALQPADLTRSPDWSSDSDAVIGAKRYFKRAGGEVEEGHRHETLLRIGCKLWWDWAFDENQVRELLHYVNTQFPLPKTDEDVEKEVQASWERTLGPRRVEQPTTYGAEREPIAKLTKTGIAELGKRLKSRNREQDRVLGRALVNVSKEKAFGEPLEAKALVLKAVDVLAREYSHEPPERVLDLLRASLIAQRALSTQHPLPSDDEIKNKIRHTQHSMRQRIEEKQRNVEDKLRERIRMGTSGQRDTPYTEKEYKDWKRRGFTDNDWIIKCGRNYYFWCNGRYDGEWDESSAAVEVFNKLAPAAGVNGHVKLHFIDKEGNARDKPFPQIVREYGRGAKKVVHSMFEEHPRYDDMAQAFYNSACERDPTLHAEYNAEIDEWLDLLGQDKADLLKDWLAASVILDKSISALNIVTPTNSGKNLIVNGLARLWHGRFQNLRDFNAVLLKDSPVVFCDEFLPVHWAGRFSTYLREMTSKNWHVARDTGASMIVVQGYMRCVFSGNSPMYEIERESLSQDAIEATMKRLVTIAHKDRDAKNFLEVPHRAARIQHEWINTGGFAKHVLWLNENRHVDTRKRFMVEDNRALELRQGIFSRRADTVYRWIFNALSTNQFSTEVLLSKTDKDTNEKRLFLYAPPLDTNWNLCMPEKERLLSRELEITVGEIAPTRSKVALSGATSDKERWKNVRIVDLTKFSAWMLENEKELDLDEVLTKLANAKKLK